MGDMNKRAECFCSFNQEDPNCFNVQEGDCPQKDECERAKAICKSLFGEKEAGVCFDYSDLNIEQKQQIETAIDTPPAATAKRARPGAAPVAPIAPVAPPPVAPNLSALEQQLQLEITGGAAPAQAPVQPVAPVAPVAPPASPAPPAQAPTGKRGPGRKSKAQKAAEAASEAAAAGQPAIAPPPAPVAPPVAPMAPVAPSVPSATPTFSPVTLSPAEIVSKSAPNDAGVVTITMHISLAEKLVNSICGLIDRGKPVDIETESPVEVSARKRPSGKSNGKKTGGKRGPKPGSKRKGKGKK